MSIYIDKCLLCFTSFPCIITAKNIYTTTSYTKQNEETNTTVNLPKEVAIQEAQIISEQQIEYYLNMENNPTTFGVIENESTTPGEFRDTYMEMTHSALDNGGGDFTYVTDATWLTQTGFSMIHEDLHAHFSYTGSVTNPQLVTNFNTNGSYSHATVALEIEPSISIDTSGDVSASIGISVIGTKDVRVAPLKVTYRP